MTEDHSSSFAQLVSLKTAVSWLVIQVTQLHIISHFLLILLFQLNSYLYKNSCVLKLIHCEYCNSLSILYLAREKLADSDPVIIPYKVINRMFTTLYGLISGSLSAYYSWARCTPNVRIELLSGLCHVESSPPYSVF